MYVMPQASILSYQGQTPRLGNGVFVAAGAHVIGDVEIGEDSSIWFNTVVRGDCNSIRIGARTNVQDGSVIHVTQGTGPTSIGSGVTIGHKAVIHGCTIADECLIGMGAVLLDGVVLPRHSFVAAGSVIPPGKTYEPGMMIMGSPARAVRPLRDAEIQGIIASIGHYLDYKRGYVPETARASKP